MEKKFGNVLARTFRELCEKSNKKAKKSFSIIQGEEIAKIGQLLKKVDSPTFDLSEALKDYLQITTER